MVTFNTEAIMKFFIILLFATSIAFAQSNIYNPYMYNQYQQGYQQGFQQGLQQQKEVDINDYIPKPQDPPKWEQNYGGRSASCKILACDRYMDTHDW